MICKATHHKLALGCSLISIFLIFLDTTIVNLALPIIEHSFRTSRYAIEWIINGYTISFAAILLGAGALTDFFGIKNIFFIGLFIFAFSSVGCGLSHTINFLNGFRVLQGIGAALILPSSLKLATRGILEQDRKLIISYWAAAGGLGLAMGPFLGGVLISIFDWYSIFFINIFICLPILIYIFFYFPKEKSNFKFKFDFLGQILLSCSLACLIFFFVELPNLELTSYIVQTSLFIFFITISTFIVYERKIANPLLPIQIYKNLNILITSLQGFLFNFMFYGVLFTLTYYYFGYLRLSILYSGVAFLPFTGFVVIGNLSSHKMSKKYGDLKTLRIANCFILLSILIIVISLYFKLNETILFVVLPIIGLSSGLIVPILTSQVLHGSVSTLHGSISAGFNTLRQLGGAVGIAIFGPLLGLKQDMLTGIVICFILCSISALISLVSTFFIKKTTTT